jgi:hypothetical protein
MKPLILRLAIATVLAAGVILPAQALDNQMKIDLQATLLSFLENASDDAGRFAVTDRSSGRLTRVYAGAMHPKIVPFGDIGKRGEAGLGKHPAGVGRAAADPADHIDRGLHIDSFGYL